MVTHTHHTHSSSVNVRITLHSRRRSVRDLLMHTAAAAMHTAFARLVKTGTTTAEPYAPLEPFATAAERYAAPSPHEASLAGACTAVSPLFCVPGTVTVRRQPCLLFMARHWQREPLVSRPGVEWTRLLMGLEEISRMVSSWPMRFYRPHGSVRLDRPNSGFTPDLSQHKEGAAVPAGVVEIARSSQRTLVIHSVDLYWPPVGALARHVCRYFQAYTQVQLYVSWPGQPVATAPHQDAHAVFVVQVHGAKRWCVYRSPAPLTLKPLQRGKNGDVVEVADRRTLGELLLNITLRPGQVLYIPRGAFHHTSTEPALLSAADFRGADSGAFGVQASGADGEAAALWASDAAAKAGEGEPSLGLTVAVACDDVFATWLFLLGEALQDQQLHHALLPAARRDAAKLVGSLRRLASLPHGGPSDARARLLESLPRALTGACAHASPQDGGQWASSRNAFTASDGNGKGWRRYALSLLRAAITEDAHCLIERVPEWLQASSK